MRITQTLFVILFLSYQLSAQTPAGQLIETTIHAPSLQNNIFDDITQQPIAVYLPPSYDSTETRYPVVYFLPGFSTHYKRFLDGTFSGLRMNSTMDNLIDQGKIKEMIVVLVNGLTFMLGSYYVNSPVRGNWEDYLVHDLVAHIDSTYRTIPSTESRGIAGHSMGGFGALNLAMLHPEIFSVTYGLSPGLFDQNGLVDQGMFSSQTAINTFLTKQQDWAAMSKDSAVAAFKSYINFLRWINDNNTVFYYAYGTAFSPNPDSHPPNINYPYYKSGDQILCDSTVLQNYENGFGGLAWKVEQYKENFLKLKRIIIDYGISDFYSWIPRGCIYFSQLLTEAEIAHELLSFNGGHSNWVRSRIENFMMPYFSESLAIDSTSTAIKKVESPNPVDFHLSNYPNPFNLSTTIVFDLPEKNEVKITAYNLLGQEIETFLHGFYPAGNHRIIWDANGLTSGIYFVRLQAGKFTKMCKILIQK